jgi:hypothetical protein
MTIKELADYLYSIVEKNPELADRDLRSVNLDINADKSNIKLDTDNALITIDNT